MVEAALWTTFSRSSLVDHSVGSVHMGLGLCALQAGGHIDVHVHSLRKKISPDCIRTVG